MLPNLRGLLEVARVVRSRRELPELFGAVARTIADVLGYATVAVNVYDRAWDDFEAVAVHGAPAVREALLGSRTSWESWSNYLDQRFDRGGAFLVPAEEVDWEDDAAHVADFAPRDDPDAWLPRDALLVPLAASDGHLLGIISVDEPVTGLRPAQEELDAAAALAAHVAAAIESAQELAAASQDRAALAELLGVSSRLNEGNGDPAELLDTVVHAVRDALAFELVVVALVDADGSFRARAAAGWPDERPLDFALRGADVEPLFDPRFERGGCFLLDRDEALGIAGRAVHESRRNGRGPHAWDRHWLLVPLHDRAGALRGFLWADDPHDRLVPSTARLEALRTFANQANAALHSALDLDALRRRNDELAALHTTTLALLDRLELADVLRAIVDEASKLVETRHAYLYLVDEAGERLGLAVRLGLFQDAEETSLRRGEGLGGHVWATGCALAVDDYATWPGRLQNHAWANLHAVLGVPLRFGDEVLGVLGVAFDVPGRRFAPAEQALLGRFAQLASVALVNARLFDALNRTEKLHRSVVESSTDMITLLDLDGNVVFASPSHERVLGRRPEELTGSRYGAHVHPDDLDAAAAVLARAVSGEVTGVFPARVRHRDGHWVHLEGIPSVIRDDHGRPELILAVTRDVSERERLQEQLRQAQKMESVGRLAGGIAHDFNNLLTAIGGYAELARLELDEESPVHEHVGEIARAASRAAELTSQLLAFSRKQVLHPRVVDLNAIVGQMATMLARMLGEDVILSTAFDGRLRPVLADPAQIEQVVLNLALNARDAMPDGGQLLIRTEALEVAPGATPPRAGLAPGAYATLVVRDSGVGMPPELAERIFEPFFTTKPVGEGTGLGLATVDGIVSQSGGVVWVESAPGAGAAFTVCLPVVDADG